MVSRQDIIQFMRCIARIHLRHSDLDHILRFVKKEVPWNFFGMLAEVEGISGLVHHHLKGLGCLDSLPKSFAEHLENCYRRNTKHTLAITEEFELIASRLEKAQIPLIVFQGLSLLEVYGDPGLRPLGDVDLLVKPEHKENLKRLMWEADYTPPVFIYPDILQKNGIAVDIHTHILNLDRITSRQHLFPQDLTPMWEKALPLSDQCEDLLILDPYDNFIALAAHALKHSYSRLIWLVDLHELLLELTRTPSGWKRMLEQARLWNQEKTVLYGLIILEWAFGLEVPFWLKTQLGVQQLSILEKHLIRLKLRGFSSPELCNGLWLCNIKRLRHKVDFVRETIFPRAEIMEQVFQNNARGGRIYIRAKRVANASTLLWQNIRQAWSITLKG